MKKKSIEQSKRKVYTTLIVILSVLTLFLSAATVWIAHPTSQHRQTAQSITNLSEKAFASPDATASEQILNSKEYKDLIASPENTYTTNASIATTVALFIASAIATVFVYRYLRKIRITRDAVGVTVWLTVIVGLVTYYPGLYISGLVAGPSSISNGAMFLISLAVLPFALVFSALLTYVVARITDNFYNRTHGFIED